MRLIFNSKRWHCDLEWGFQIKDEPETEEPEHGELQSETQIDPESIEVEESTVAKAHKVIGFRPNPERKEYRDG